MNYKHTLLNLLFNKFCHFKKSSYFCSRNFNGMFTPCLISASIPFYKRGTQKKYGKMVENLEGEIWKPVVGYEGKYEVSNLGRVKSVKFGRWGKEDGLRKLMKDKDGYYIVSLIKNGKVKNFFVHRLVYNSFVGKLPAFDFKAKGNERLEINHKNEIKTDNRLENLELITCTENNNYGSHAQRGADTRAANKRVYQYNTSGELIKIWKSPIECKKSGFGPSKVGQCCRNKYNHPYPNIYKGFIWSYTPLKKEDKDV